jgi:ATP-dependent DNA helicase RecG
VSKNLIDDHAVSVVEIKGCKIVAVRVPRASRRDRPIYVGTNPMDGTYRRNYEGDYRCDSATVRRMIADAQDEPYDAIMLDKFTMDDIDLETLGAYRQQMRIVNAQHPFLTGNDRELLRSLGGWTYDRYSGREGLTIAGLLMFGRLRSILDALPNYVLDYREIHSNTERWSDRLTTDGTWSGNLFDFYRRAYTRLTSDLRVPFKMEGASRIDASPIHEALREALVNTLIHADYNGTTPILIMKHTDRFYFRNPGNLRVPLRMALQGGTSDCRNRNLQKMFQLAGAAEQAGSGLVKILRAWHEQHWYSPLIREELEPDRTELQLTMVSLLPEQSLQRMRDLFGEDRFNALPENERLALVAADIEGKVTNQRLQMICDLHPRDITLMFKRLVSDGYLEPHGTSSATYYTLMHQRPSISKPNSELSTSNSELWAPNSELSSSSSELLTLNSEQPAAGLDIAGLSERPEARLGQEIRNSRKASPEAIRRVILEFCSEFRTVRAIAGLLERSADTVRLRYISAMVAEGLERLRLCDTKLIKSLDGGS